MKKFFSTSPLGVLCIILFTCSICYFVLYACRKIDQRTNLNQIDHTERFFKTSSDVHPAVKKVIDVMRKINDKRKFINKFVEKQGFALWNKAYVTPIRPANTASRLEASDYSVMIPLVWDDKPMVHSAIAAKVTSDSVYFTLMDGSNYADYNADSASRGMNGRQLSLTLMFLDNLVFGHVMFQVNDSASFPYKDKKVLLVAAPDSIVPNTSGLARMEIISYTICTTIMVPPHEGQLVGCAPDDPNCNGYVPITHCDTYTIYGDDGYGQDGGDSPPPDISVGNGNGGNDYCRLFPGGISHNCGAGDPPGWVPISDDNYTPYSPLIHDSVNYTRILKDSFPCLYHLLKDSLQNGNMLAQVLGVNLFNDSTVMHITYSISDSITTLSQPAAYTHSGAVFVNGSNISEETVSIEFNPYYMKHGTKEFMLSVALHELFHLTFNLRWGQYQYWLNHPYTMYDSAWMKQHYPIFWYYELSRPAPSNEIASHEALAGHYADTLANIMRPFYNKAASTATRDTALKALSFGGLLQSTAWKLLPSIGIDTCKYLAMLISAQNSQTDNSHPLGCASGYHYNYNTDLKQTSNCN
jgi:hypothetical protein